MYNVASVLYKNFIRKDPKCPTGLYRIDSKTVRILSLRVTPDLAENEQVYETTCILIENNARVVHSERFFFLNDFLEIFGHIISHCILNLLLAWCLLRHNLCLLKFHRYTSFVLCLHLTLSCLQGW